MVEGGAGPSGGLIPLPGIGAAAINEASEILQQLNKPFRTVTRFEYNKQGLVTKVVQDEVTPLLLIMAVSAPIVVVSVVRILELAAGTGKALSGVAAGIPEKAKSLVDDALDEAQKTGGNIGDVFEAIWKLTVKTGIFVRGIP